MTDKQQEALAMLNDMYHSQSKEYRDRYERNYFALVDFIMDSYEVRVGPALSPEDFMQLRLTAAECPDDPLIPPDKAKIMNTLQLFGDDRKKAAQSLGISERTLYRRMKQYGLV